MQKFSAAELATASSSQHKYTEILLSTKCTQSFQDYLESANTLHSKHLWCPPILVLIDELFSVVPSIARCAS